MSLAEALILKKKGVKKVDIEMSTGKLELRVEKRTRRRIGELEKIDKYYYFLVFLRVCSLSITYSMLRFGKYLANV